MVIIDTILIGGIRFVLDKVAAAVETELNDDTALREQLLAAQMRVELGEMSQAEFDVFEADILARLRDIRDSRQGSGPPPCLRRITRSPASRPHSGATITSDGSARRVPHG